LFHTQDDDDQVCDTLYEYLQERYFDNHAEYISEEEPNAQALLCEDKEICEYFEVSLFISRD